MTEQQPIGLPDKPVLEGLESKWSQVWRDEKTYAFQRPGSRADVFSIDTPPPTVSGSLHVGHVFSYTHTDLVARYQRRPSQTRSARCPSAAPTSSSCATS